MKIPDYYRQFQTNPQQGAASKDSGQKNSETPSVKTEQKSSQNRKPQDKKAEDKTVPFNANEFTLNMLDGWEDKTIYTLTGPVTDGIQHNIIITSDKENPFDTLPEYAEWHIKAMETDLKGCTLLKKGVTNLTSGANAYEAIFSWYPTDELKIYQHQIFVLFEKTVFKLTASFTKKTRETLGPQVLRMMLSFNPSKPQS